MGIDLAGLRAVHPPRAARQMAGLPHGERSVAYRGVDSPNE